MLLSRRCSASAISTSRCSIFGAPQVASCRSNSFWGRRGHRQRTFCSPEPEAKVKHAPAVAIKLDEDLRPASNNGKPLTATMDGVEQEQELLALETAADLQQKYGWLAFWVASAIAFGGGIYITEGAGKAQEFFAGYILEQSLSIDNLFVFVLVFSYFKTPVAGQTQVLTYGIATAAFLRAILIIGGVELVAIFEPVLGLFAAVLLFSSYKLLSNVNEDDDGDLSDNDVVKLCTRFIKCTDSYDGTNFFTRLADGTRAATPLLLTLAVVEISDVVFAVDSIPAVFGVTLDPFIVYTSNIFAILSLRSVYSFVSTVMTELRFLDKAVAMVLGFIGVKMLLEIVEVRVPTDVSLEIVGLVLGGGVMASLLFPLPQESSE